MSKRILFVVSEWGYWGEELVGPLEVCQRQNYQVDIVTPKGQRPVAIGVSMDSNFKDPPLGKCVVDKQMAERVRAIDVAAGSDRDIFRNCKSLKGWFPKNPYPSEPTYLRLREKYFSELDDRKAEIGRDYDALLLVGGSGPLIDMVNNYQVHDLIRIFYELDKPIAAECYGVTCLAFTRRSDDDRRPVIWGKHVTGHPQPYDYTEGTGFMGTDLVTEFPTIPLQLVLELAVGPDGLFHGNVGKSESVVVDYPFITGRSTPDSYGTGERLVQVLEKRMRRDGW
jgi:putative intracellular protease/amidase